MPQTSLVKYLNLWSKRISDLANGPAQAVEPSKGAKDWFNGNPLSKQPWQVNSWSETFLDPNIPTEDNLADLIGNQQNYFSSLQSALNKFANGTSPPAGTDDEYAWRWFNDQIIPLGTNPPQQVLDFVKKQRPLLRH